MGVLSPSAKLLLTCKYPHETAGCLQECCALYTEVLTQQIYSHLLENSINNLCFFFGDPNESFFVGNGTSQLDNLVESFSNERWVHVKEVHCILPNMKTGQAYITIACNKHTVSIIKPPSVSSSLCSTQTPSQYLQSLCIIQTGIIPTNYWSY